MKSSFPIEIYKDKIESNLLNIEIIQLNKYSTFVVLRNNFNFNEEFNFWNFNEYCLVIPSFYNVTKEDVMNNFFDWLIAAQDNEALNNRKFAFA